MNILQRIRSVFPLRSNATVQKLEEALESSRFQEGLLRTAAATLKEINEEFFSANQKLAKDLEDAQEEAAEFRDRSLSLQRRLGEFYQASKMFGGFDLTWPSNGFMDRRFSFSLESLDTYVVRIQLERQALAMAIPVSLTRANIDYDIWAAAMATEIGKHAEKAAYTEALRQLSLHKHRCNKETI